MDAGLLIQGAPSLDRGAPGKYRFFNLPGMCRPRQKPCLPCGRYAPGYTPKTITKKYSHLYPFLCWSAITKGLGTADPTLNVNDITSKSLLALRARKEADEADLCFFGVSR